MRKCGDWEARKKRKIKALKKAFLFDKSEIRRRIRT